MKKMKESYPTNQMMSGRLPYTSQNTVSALHRYSTEQLF